MTAHQQTQRHDRRIQRIAAAISASLAGSHNTVREELRRLLVHMGRLPPNVRGRSDRPNDAVADTALRKLLDMLRPLLEIVLPQAVDDDYAFLAGIRRFFLVPQSAYTLDELAALWRVNMADVRDVFADELAAWADGDSVASDPFRVSWNEARLTSIAYNFFRPIDVERALGSDFGRVHAESWRTVPLVLHVPRFMVDVLTVDDLTTYSNRTPSACIEQYVFDLFSDDHYEEFAAALNAIGAYRSTAASEPND